MACFPFLEAILGLLTQLTGVCLSVEKSPSWCSSVVVGVFQGAPVLRCSRGGIFK